MEGGADSRLAPSAIDGEEGNRTTEMDRVEIGVKGVMGDEIEGRRGRGGRRIKQAITLQARSEKGIAGLGVGEIDP